MTNKNTFQYFVCWTSWRRSFLPIEVIFFMLDFIVKIVLSHWDNNFYARLHSKDYCRPLRQYLLWWTSWQRSFSPLEAISFMLDFMASIIFVPWGNIFYVILHGENPYSTSGKYEEAIQHLTWRTYSLIIQATYNFSRGTLISKVI